RIVYIYILPSLISTHLPYTTLFRSRVMIYADGYYRSGKLIDHKRSADLALDVAAKEGTHVEKVLVWRRYHGQYLSATPMTSGREDRKSTRLNSSHVEISYAVFCLKK